MLLTILGWAWIITGVFFLFKPERLRNKLRKKSVKKLKRFFFALALGLGFLLIKATWGVPGLLAKVVMIFGFLGIFKAAYLIKAKAADKLIEWYIQQPLKFYRISACVQIVIGGIILTI